MTTLELTLLISDYGLTFTPTHPNGDSGVVALTANPVVQTRVVFGGLAGMSQAEVVPVIQAVKRVLVGMTRG